MVGSHSNNVNLLEIDKIPASTPPQVLLQCILDHEKNGVPLVITGVNLDPRWCFQPSSSLEFDAPVESETGIV